MVKLVLLEKGAGLESKENSGWALLSRAAESGYEGVVKLLLDEGAEVDSKDDSGRTPLSWATESAKKNNGWKERDAVVKLLLEKGSPE